MEQQACAAHGLVGVPIGDRRAARTQQPTRFRTPLKLRENRQLGHVAVGAFGVLPRVAAVVIAPGPLPLAMGRESADRKTNHARRGRWLASTVRPWSMWWWWEPGLAA